MANWFTRILGGPSPEVVATGIPQPDPGVLRRVTHRAFDIARSGRRLKALPSSTTAINQLIRTYGRTAVARSRYLCTNNAYAVAAKETFVGAMAGYGIKPSTLEETPEDKKVVQRAWLDWVAEADADRLTDFYGMQATGAAELFEGGEFFAVEVPAPKNTTVPLSYRMLPTEMLQYTNMPAEPLAQGHYIDLGIEFDADGNKVAYHFFRNHPGDQVTDPNKIRRTMLMRVEADKVLHVFRPVRAGQIRGIPFTLSALISLALLDLYDDAELERKRTTALFTAFITKQPQDQTAGIPDDPLGSPTDVPAGAGSAVHGGPTDVPAMAMEPGAMVDLLPGETVTVAQPAEVGNSYEQFQYRQLLRIAAGFGIPYAAMTGDLRQANYGSIRAGMIEFKRRIVAMQNHVFIFQFCRPVWNRWMDVAATMRGKVLPWTLAVYTREKVKHQRTKWLPPRWDWVDPAKDLQAEKVAIDNGMKALSDSIEENGYDPEETFDRIKADQDALKARDISLNIGGQPPQPAADPNANPDGGDQPPTAPKENADGE